MTDVASFQRVENEDPVLGGYQRMASDTEREEEAEDWCEGLIGDASSGAEDEYPATPSQPESR